MPYKEELPLDEGNGKKEIAALEIARMVLDPTKDKLPGMTRIPLDMVRPCSFAASFAQELIKLCELAKESQRQYTENWKLWHSAETEIKGVGKRTPPIGSQTFGSNDVDTIDVDTDSQFEIPDIEDSMVVEWLGQYYLLRRSTTPDYSMGAFELASREVEGRRPDESDLFKDAPVQ